MRQLVLCKNKSSFQHDVPDEKIAELIHDPSSVLWLDISDPDASDIDILRHSFGFHELAIEDATHDGQRPKIDVYQGYYLIVFYAAAFDKESERIVTQEMDLFVGSNYIVSVHKGEMKQVQETIARWKSPQSPVKNRVPSLVYTLLDTIVDDYFPLVDQIADRVDDLEDDIFIDYKDSAIQSIFQLKRDMLTLRRSLAPERDVLNVLLRRELPMFHMEDLAYLQDLYDHIVRVTDSIDTYRDLLSSALDSFLSLQSNRLNQIVKVLTIASIILMSDALVAGIYGMNFKWMPELDWTFGYPLALGLMALISVGLILLFRKLKWI